MQSVNSALVSPAPKQQDRAMLTGVQIRAARALLRWTTGELAKRSGVGIATVHRAEAVDDVPPMNARTLMKLRNSLQEAGVEFLDGQYSGGGGPGVRLKGD